MRSDLSRDEGGAALVEAALVLPIILLLVFGLMDLSLYFWNASLAGKAVQLGLRRAIVSDPVAIGPGLDRNEDSTYWAGLPLGLRCLSEAGGRSPCPDFSVECTGTGGCRCAGTCRFTFASARVKPILDAMRTVMPNLRPENVRIAYATNGLGYVGRPLPVPVDVTVDLVGLDYRTLFLGDLLGSFLPLRASAKSPSEDLTSR